MDFELTKEQKDIAKVAREFAESIKARLL